MLQEATVSIDCMTNSNSEINTPGMLTCIGGHFTPDMMTIPVWVTTLLSVLTQLN